MTVESKLTREQTERLGRDLLARYGTGDGRQGNVDLAVHQVRSARGILFDLDRAVGIDNAVQSIVHRINTRRGELSVLGHPNYGSRHHELIGEPNTEHNRQLMKLYILQALAEEPRIAAVEKAVIRYDRTLDPSRVDLVLDMRIEAVGEVINLVVPFYFEVNA